MAAYHCCRRETVNERVGLALLFGSVLAWLAYEVLAWRLGRPVNATTALVKRAKLLQDHIIAAAFAVHLVGFHAAARPMTATLARIAGAVRWLAGASFTLYLTHFPIITFLFACMPWPNVDFKSRIAVFTLTLILVFLIASLTERKKDAWRRALNRAADYRPGN